MTAHTFAGQVALVTGASRGIGRAIAAELARQGLNVFGTATTPAGAEAIGASLAAQGGRGVVLDVNDAAGCEAVVESIVKDHGTLHVLVNNAGITRDMLAMRMKDEDWDAVLDTNLKAVFRMSAGPGTGQSRHHGQLCRSGIRCDRHDGETRRGSEGGAARADPAGPAGCGR